mgnify:CR=1 FL=1
MDISEPIPLYLAERDPQSRRGWLVIEYAGGNRVVAKNGIADRGTALWVAQLLAKRTGGRLLTDMEMHAEAHIRRWEDLGWKFSVGWSERFGYHVLRTEPTQALCEEQQRAHQKLVRSHNALRNKLRGPMVSFLIARDGDPKPSEFALEMSELLRTRRLDAERARALAGMFKRDDVESVLHTILRGAPDMVADKEDQLSAANYLLLASMLADRLREPHLRVVPDDNSTKCDN